MVNLDQCVYLRMFINYNRNYIKNLCYGYDNSNNVDILIVDID